MIQLASVEAEPELAETSAMPEPAVTLLEPEPTILEPEPTIAEPELTIAEPEPTIAEPEQLDEPQPLDDPADELEYSAARPFEPLDAHAAVADDTSEPPLGAPQSAPPPLSAQFVADFEAMDGFVPLYQPTRAYRMSRLVRTLRGKRSQHDLA